jgi:hypothetical protein
VTDRTERYRFPAHNLRAKGTPLPKRHRRPIATTCQTGWRRWVAIFALLAFAAQVQITQAHIHFALGFGVAAAKADADGAAVKLPAKKNFPPTNDPANCPICQAALHGGQFLTPTAAALALPSETASIVPFVLRLVAAHETPSHNWQGRAPPHA